MVDGFCSEDVVLFPRFQNQVVGEFVLKSVNCTTIALQLVVLFAVKSATGAWADTDVPVRTEPTIKRNNRNTLFIPATLPKVKKI